jgi:hypothetical protein
MDEICLKIQILVIFCPKIEIFGTFLLTKNWPEFSEMAEFRLRSVKPHNENITYCCDHNDRSIMVDNEIASCCGLLYMSCRSIVISAV